MDGAGLAGAGDGGRAAMLTMSYRDLEESSAPVVDPLGPGAVPRLNGAAPPTDKNGNNLPLVAYGHLNGIDSHICSAAYNWKGKERKNIYIAPFCTKVHTKRSGMYHPGIQLQLTNLSTPKGRKTELA